MNASTFQVSVFFTYLLSFLVVLFALFSVTQKQILRSVFSLMMVLLMTAGFYILLKAEFLAGVQVLVYVGGVIILMIFSIMLTGDHLVQDQKIPFLKKLMALGISSLFFFSTSYSLFMTPLIEPTKLNSSSVRSLGLSLLDTGSQGFILPFELISLLLLAVFIGALVVARKIPETLTPQTKSQKGAYHD